MKLRFGKWDALAVAAVVLLAVLVAAVFLSKGASRGSYAEVYQHGKLLKTLSLSLDQEFAITGSYRATVTVQDGKIAVTDSDCPGGDCLRTGWLGRAGRSIVCIPGGLEIRVVENDADVDFVVG